ncbi:MAG: hypothetical protein FWD79_08520 [Desulfobulbus sp.]|nr:hypothetical protein [Desulfobulbus sp.]
MGLIRKGSAFHLYLVLGQSRDDLLADLGVLGIPVAGPDRPCRWWKKGVKMVW